MKLLMPIFYLLFLLVYFGLILDMNNVWTSLHIALFCSGVVSYRAFFSDSEDDQEYVVIHKREDMPRLWDVVYKFLPKKNDVHQVRLMPKGSESLGLCSLESNGKYTISLSEDALALQDELLETVAAHEVAHMIQKHSIFTIISYLFSRASLFLMVALSIDNILLFLEGKGNVVNLIICLFWILLAFQFGMNSSSMVMQEREFGAWVRASLLTSPMQVLDFLASRARIGVFEDETGNIDDVIYNEFYKHGFRLFRVLRKDPEFRQLIDQRCTDCGNCEGCKGR